ncbi:1,6-anhydro-N-acetylmuramyl-L-alanine amidase AmpD [Bacterioplanes sanyensis]|uniref:1,6-anhydro-N-acetylmuramyl-L-alanine amidase AmpD n=1 Tax=Bacterioplanes sanyensis TaxID=1249553 RepID=UPI001E29169E|nr:1,6-anhydro-N-acetylmuramyl-L-alanine amidase AmpD [Bacterioplanes sanyensis]
MVDHRLQPAQWCPSPNYGERPAGAEVSLLVLHNISLPPGQFGGGHIQAFFQNQLPPEKHPYFQQIASLQVSAHLLIERDGQLTQFVAFDRRAWHAGVSSFAGRADCNDFSIGIELEGCDDQAYSDAQYQQLALLIPLLQAHYPIAGRIVGHEHIAPGRKTDPGPAFDWRRLANELQLPLLPATDWEVV